MTYNPNTPQPTEIPSQSQSRFLTNFTLLNQYFGQDHTPPGNVITLATNAAPIVITSAGHGLVTGNMVTVYDLTGIDGNTPVAWPINGNTFTITRISSSRFSLQGSNGTSYPTYLAGTGNFSSPSYLYGYHKQLSAPGPLPSDPTAIVAGGDIYSKIFLQPNGNPRFSNPDFFFQNLSKVVQLTRLFNNAKASSTGGTKWSFVTPWGLIFSTGLINSGPTGATSTNFAIPYTTVNFGVVIGCIKPPSPLVTSVTTTSLTGFSFGARSGNFGGAGNVKTYYLSIGI